LCWRAQTSLFRPFTLGKISQCVTLKNVRLWKTYNDLDREFSNSYFMTVCTNEQQLEQLVKMITPLLKKVGGVFLVTEANWLVH